MFLLNINLLIIDNNSALDIIFVILGIAVWRDENFIFKIPKEKIDALLKGLYTSFFNAAKIGNKKQLQYNLELLLGLLRLKNRYQCLLPDDKITKKFQKVVNAMIKNRLEIDSKIELDIDTNINISPLLYALNIYLYNKEDLSKGIKIVGME